MSQEELELYVARLETYAQQHPVSYKLRVALAAALGYAYVYAVLGLAVALFGLWVIFAARSPAPTYVIAAVGGLLVVFVYAVVRVLWVRGPLPTGVELDRHSAPRLFLLLDKLTSTLRIPSVNQVVLTDDFSARVVQVPRLGALWWRRSYLCLGFPLMQALTPRQLSAVVARELGLHASLHDRFAGWMYRVRRTWSQFLRVVQREQPFGAVLFRPFLEWYVPFVNACSFVMARANEYAADQCAARVAGSKKAAEALINLEVKARCLKVRVRPNLFKQADHLSLPPVGTFGQMCRELSGGLAAQDEAQWLDEALARETTYDATRPCLSDRLSALGFAFESDGGADHYRERLPLPATAKRTAAEEFLGDDLARYTERLDEGWGANITPEWQERHAQVQDSLTRLKAFSTTAEVQSLDADEVWERARLTAEFLGHEQAIPLLREVLQEWPNHAGANYALGRILLENDDEAGLAPLDKAMNENPDCVLPGCALAHTFLTCRGKREEAEGYAERTVRHRAFVARAQLEREEATAEDTFQSHELSVNKVERLGEQLYGYPLVGDAYLTRKVVTYFPKRPCYVLGIVPRWTYWLFPWSGNAMVTLANRLESDPEMGGDVLVIILNADSKIRKLKPKIQAIEGVHIYSRSTWRKASV